jgi:hyperosmotically inducible protein
MLKQFAIVLSVAALSATVACSKTDSGVNRSVKSKIAADETTKGSDIAVDTGQKTVTLNGTVASGEQKARADQIAQNTKGVKGVVDDITVNPRAAATSGSDGAQASTTEKATAKTEDTAHAAKVKTEKAASKTGEVIEDSAITTDLKAKFLAEPGVPGTDIHVETTKGVVTLSGNVKTKVEETKALSIARGTKGVKHVVNHMKIAA